MVNNNIDNTTQFHKMSNRSLQESIVHKVTVHVPPVIETVLVILCSKSFHTLSTHTISGRKTRHTYYVFSIYV